MKSTDIYETMSKPKRLHFLNVTWYFSSAVIKEKRSAFALLFWRLVAYLNLEPNHFWCGSWVGENSPTPCLHPLCPVLEVGCGESCQENEWQCLGMERQKPKPGHLGDAPIQHGHLSGRMNQHTRNVLVPPLSFFLIPPKPKFCLKGTTKP